MKLTTIVFITVTLLMVSILIMMKLHSRESIKNNDNSIDLLTTTPNTIEEELTTITNENNNNNSKIIKINASELRLGDILRDSNSKFCRINKIVPENDKIILIGCGNETHHLDSNYQLVVRRKMI